MGHCHDGTGLGFLVPVKGNCNATVDSQYKDILYIWLSTVWQQFDECPHMGVMVRYPQIFGHLQYTCYTFSMNHNNIHMVKLISEILLNDAFVTAASASLEAETKWRIWHSNFGLAGDNDPHFQFH